MPWTICPMVRSGSQDREHVWHLLEWWWLSTNHLPAHFHTIFILHPPKSTLVFNNASFVRHTLFWYLVKGVGSNGIDPRILFILNVSIHRFLPLENKSLKGTKSKIHPDAIFSRPTKTISSDNIYSYLSAWLCFSILHRRRCTYRVKSRTSTRKNIHS